MRKYLTLQDHYLAANSETLIPVQLDEGKELPKGEYRIINSGYLPDMCEFDEFSLQIIPTMTVLKVYNLQDEGVKLLLKGIPLAIIIPMNINSILPISTGINIEETNNKQSNPIENTTSVNIQNLERIERLKKKLDLSHLQIPLKEQVLDFLLERADTFALELKEIAEVTIGYNEIKLTDDTPIKCKPYRIPYYINEQVNDIINEWLEAGIIRPSKSPYNFPLVVAPKKDGSLRVAVDYRKLNEKTIRDEFPLPHCDQILARLGTAKIFTALDCFSGFMAIRNHPDDVHKTAFSTTHGHWEMVRMGFGGTNFPATYMRIMTEVLKDYIGKICYVFMDDIVIFSDNIEQHFKDVSKIMTTVKEYGLRLKPSKCSYFTDNVDFLGFHVTLNGLEPTNRLVDKILDIPPPNSKKTVQSFIGSINYYRKLIPDCAKKLTPIVKLLKKGNDLSWDEECQQAFEQLKKDLAELPKVIHPNYNKPFRLCTDASDYALGGVLEQQQDESDNESFQPIWYISKSLRGPELRYTTTQKELYAIVYCIKVCRPFLYGKKFTVIIDHKPLKGMIRYENHNSRIIRWLIKLQEYDFDIIYREGKKHNNADLLSRIPPAIPEPQYEPDMSNIKFINFSDDEDESNSEKNQTNFFIALAVQDAPTYFNKQKKLQFIGTEDFTLKWTIDDVIEQQRKSPMTKAIIEYLENYLIENEKDKEKRKVTVPPRTDIKDFYLDERGVLMHEETNHQHARGGVFTQVYIPNTEFQIEILKWTHDYILSSHPGINACFQKVRQNFYWPRMYETIREYIKTCHLCQINKKSPDELRPLMRFSPVHRPFERVSMDLIVNLPLSINGNKHILVCVDYLTKFVEAFPLPDMNTHTIAKTFVLYLITRYGAPKELITDKGANFCSELMNGICQFLKIKKATTTSYHPQCNGQVERINKIIKQCLRFFVDRQQRDWDEALPLILFAYRNAYNSVTKDTPFFLLYGYDPALPYDEIKNNKTPLYDTLDNYKSALIESMRTTFRVVEENIEKAAERNEEYRSRFAKERSFTVGDLVLIKQEQAKSGLSKKLQAIYLGPYRIVKQLSQLVFTVHLLNNPDNQFNINSAQFKPYLLRDVKLSKNEQAVMQHLNKRRCKRQIQIKDDNNIDCYYTSDSNNSDSDQDSSDSDSDKPHPVNQYLTQSKRRKTRRSPIRPEELQQCIPPIEPVNEPEIEQVEVNDQNNEDVIQLRNRIVKKVPFYRKAHKKKTLDQRLDGLKEAVVILKDCGHQARELGLL